MAKVNINAITEHFRGKLGDIVFKRIMGRLVVSLRPKPSLIPPSGAQQTQQLRFSQAISYGRAALAVPATRALYERVGAEKQMGALPAAVADFFNPPVILDMKLDGYLGLTGQPIVVRAKDDTEVVGVSVVLRDAVTNLVVEQGAAVLQFGEWVYTATTTLAPNQQVLIEVAAKDRPGNQGVQSTSYP